MAIKITIEDFSKTLRWRFLPSIHNAIEEGLVDGGKVLAAQTRREIQSENLVYTREMLESVETQRIRDGAEVRVSAPHAKWIEYGTRPFTPPLTPLKWWAMNKLGLDEDEAMKLAWHIQQKFRREGIKPRFFFRSAIRKSLPKIKLAIEKRVLRAEHRLFRKVGGAVLG